ncbi:MAG: sugar transferase [Candidatus Omnitrophota bacterium]
MLRERVTFLRRLMKGADAVIAVSSFLAACLISGSAHSLCRDKLIFPAAAVFLFSWLIALSYSGIYDSLRTRRILLVLFLIVKAAAISLIINAACFYIFHLQDLSRMLIGISTILCAGVVFVSRLMLMLFSRFFRRRGYNFRRILIIGSGKRAKRFISLVEEHEEWGLKIVGVVDKDPALKGIRVMDYTVLGTFEDIPRVIHENVVDEVVFVVPRSWLDSIEGVILFLEAHGLVIHIALDYFELKIARARQNDLHGFPLLTFESTPYKAWQLVVKRLWDIFVSFTLLLLLSPVFALIAVIIKMGSRGPVFFRQKRCGLNGRKFTLYKFRTMVLDAEQRLDKLRGMNEMNGPVFKIKNDPRLTGVGHFLRKSSIDEFPQLWNVLNGQMSLVGPRPPLPEELAKYDYWQRRRLSMKPGLTCLWQVGGRNKIRDFNEWLMLDLEYIDRWSIGLDVLILLRTIPAVLSGRGAG